MDVLIVETDELIAGVLSDALSADGISVAIMPNEEEAMRACRDGSSRVVITGINRRSEDMKGLYFARAMRVRCPWLAVVFMAALWPVRLHQRALGIRERFLTKPIAMLKLVRTVRELLATSQPA
jgi:DNA-binding response OmpR family regulator